LVRFDLVVVVVVSADCPVVIAESVDVAGSAVVGAVGVIGVVDCIDGSACAEPAGAPGIAEGSPGMVDGAPGIEPGAPVCAPPGAGVICETAAVESPSAAMAAKVTIRMGLVLYCDMTFIWVGIITPDLRFGPSFRRRFRPI
jgi:hypothetical protein